MEIIQLIKYSPKRQVTLENIQKQQEHSSTLGIRTLCPTRWTVRTGAMQAIVTNYEALRETMEDTIVEDGYHIVAMCIKALERM